MERNIEYFLIIIKLAIEKNAFNFSHRQKQFLLIVFTIKNQVDQLSNKDFCDPYCQEKLNYIHNLLKKFVSFEKNEKTNKHNFSMKEVSLLQVENLLQMQNNLKNHISNKKVNKDYVDIADFVF